MRSLCTRPEKGQTYIGIYILLVLLHSTLHWGYIIAGVTTKDTRFQKKHVPRYIQSLAKYFLFSFLQNHIKFTSRLVSFNDMTRIKFFFTRTTHTTLNAVATVMRSIRIIYNLIYTFYSLYANFYIKFGHENSWIRNP